MADLHPVRCPPAGGRDPPGRQRRAFDWSALTGVKDARAFMLSGGLTPDNVAEAIRVTGAATSMFPPASRARPGEKDPDLIRRFLHAAKAR